MDTLIKMCNHPKIQDGWEPKVGDWTDKGVVVRFTGKSYNISSADGLFTVYSWIEDLIYLPGIPQLMGMVRGMDEFSVDDYEVSIDFTEFIRHEFKYNNESAQELWLAFVMHELHQLRWSDERWE